MEVGVLFFSRFPTVRRRAIVRTLILLLCTLAGMSIQWGTTSAQTLALWADSLETNCNIVAPYPGGPVTAYIIGTMSNGADGCALSGSFRIDGLPSGWSASIVSIEPPPNLVLGDPFDVTGVYITYPGCVINRRFVMQISITPGSAETNVAIVPVPHTDFSTAICGFEGLNCIPGCANFCTDNGFGYDCNCFEPRGTTINGAACFVAVAESAWGEVKTRYREE